ncbi:MAG: DUF167 domain-containing protein [Euryhalocaulis sp.]|uniref:DUF167 family protein n=1 Tax=Euryhalocaulis sp. TaxID=2744307 RepID=UPI00180A489B|nr:DUF167 family protein [Euryhalocaulis sp.]MBA4801017.1 DUF167 domain-containing protein [Euryhalocaulis sp.]
MSDALESVSDGFRLRVRLTPNASGDRFEGAFRDAAGRQYLKARVRAVPEKGKANTALIALAAKALSVPKGAVTLESGSTSRLKTLHISESGALARAEALLET